MKKLVSAIAMVALFASSCKKNEVATNPGNTGKGSQSTFGSRTGVSTEYGMVSFANFNYYEALVQEPDSTEKADWMAEAETMSFNSLLDNPNTVEGLGDSIESEFFKSILNEKGCVKIGNYIFRIDPSNEKVYVLEVPTSGASSGDLADLYAGTLTNNSIIAIDTELETLEILLERINDIENTGFTGSLSDWWNNYYDSETNPATEERCSEDGTAHRKSSDAKSLLTYNCHNCGGPTVDVGSFGAEVEYNKFGIYFTLVSRSLIINSDREYVVYAEINPVHYKKRCSSWYGPDSETYKYIGKHLTTDGDADGTNRKYRPYEGMKVLSKYRFHMIYTVSSQSGLWNYPNYVIDVEVRANL